jgi:hypothetical protein
MVGLVYELFASFCSTTVFASSTFALSVGAGVARADVRGDRGDAPGRQSADVGGADLCRTQVEVDVGGRAARVARVADGGRQGDRVGLDRRSRGERQAEIVRSGFGAGTPITWNSATWPLGAPVFAVKRSRTSAAVALTGMVTVLPRPG